MNSGAAAGQDEPHYHVHIIPRRAGDGFDIPLPFDGSEMPDRTVLDAYAARIISALRDPMRIDASGTGIGRDGHGERRRPHARRVVAVPIFDESARRSPSQAPERVPADRRSHSADSERRCAWRVVVRADSPMAAADA